LKRGAADSLPELTDRELKVFGVSTFRRPGTQFQPLVFGPVDAGYRLGPGDELHLVLTGDVEAAYPLNVSREGIIVIPDVGQVSVNGLTLAQLEDQLYTRLGRVYSGISRSSSATARFQISLGRLRMNQVYVRGEVAVPGAHQVSSSGGLFHALYQAGGPTADGTFRSVQVHRGGRLLHEVDLYEYLVGGSTAADIRLEHNDHVFVPPAGAQVQVDGAVRRPGIYEVKPGEDLKTVLTFAAGLRSGALARNVQIDRILPPNEQRPGHYRDLVTVDLSRLAAEGTSERLVDGDVVTVSAVIDERRNRVWIDGEVYNPGVYEWRDGMTLWGLIGNADGLTDRAYTSRAQVFRLVGRDRARALVPATLERDATGRPLADVTLAENDSVVILSREELRTPEAVQIDGFVKHPDRYTLARGMTVKDLILAAGGFVDGAYVMEAELTRLPDPLQRTDTTAHVVRVNLTAGSDNGPVDASGIPVWLPRADEIVLRHGDHVFVRRAPGYDVLRTVTVTGQVGAPGTYVLAQRDERLSRVIQRAGGLTGEANAAGLHVIRNGSIVAGDLQRGLRVPGDRNDIVLVEGDSVHVPAFDPTVAVTGAISFEARVLYQPGRGLDYYINQAGGYLDNADTRRVTVSYPNGERTGTRGHWWGGGAPPIRPGSQIFVPQKPESQPGVNLDLLVTRVAALLTAAATLLIALR
jgi:polysaccharide export outer membrane protein